jgi:hypothetical protein
MKPVLSAVRRVAPHIEGVSFDFQNDAVIVESPTILTGDEWNRVQDIGKETRRRDRVHPRLSAIDSLAEAYAELIKRSNAFNLVVGFALGGVPAMNLVTVSEFKPSEKN